MLNPQEIRACTAEHKYMPPPSPPLPLTNTWEETAAVPKLHAQAVLIVRISLRRQRAQINAVQHCVMCVYYFLK